MWFQSQQILEPRFNGDTLAMLLNIPPQKTLLRRHLTTNFNVLIGPEAQQEKREIIESTAYTPLTTTAKVRVGYTGIIEPFRNMIQLLSTHRLNWSRLYRVT